MTKADKIYTFLTIFFSVLVVIGNVIYQKIVGINIFDVHMFQLSVGAMFYPLTFLITDLITEFYGKERARTCVRFSIAMNIIVALMISIMDALPATEWSKIDGATFHKVFGFYNVVFVGSILACFISQMIDVSLYTWIRKVTNSKYLWLRSNGSTAISLFIDTSVIIIFMGIFGVIPKDKVWTIIVNSYSFKLFFTLCSTPFFYGCVKLIRWIGFSEKP